MEIEIIREGGARLNGKDEPQGKIIDISNDLAKIWIRENIGKEPDSAKTESQESSEAPENNNSVTEFPQKIENGKYLLSNGQIFEGGKAKAIAAEEALKQPQ